MNLLLSSAYLAPIHYYTKLLYNDTVFIEKNDNYVKQTFRNRCSILSANGVMSLSIPIEHRKGEKCLMKDVEIAEQGDWRHLHWNALVSAYNSTPFFEYYSDDFCSFYERKYKYLFDFNEELRLMICDLLNIDTNNIKYTTEYISNVTDNDKDFRDLIHPKKDFRLIDSDFSPVSYYQVFSRKFGFVENLSIVDLLFNMGNESLLTLIASSSTLRATENVI